MSEVLLLPAGDVLDVAHLADTIRVIVPVELPREVSEHDAKDAERHIETRSIVYIRAEFTTPGARHSLDLSCPDAVGRTVYVASNHYHEFVL